MKFLIPYFLLATLGFAQTNFHAQWFAQAEKLGLSSTGLVLVVNADPHAQTMTVFDKKGTINKTFKVSTAKKGIGNKVGSEKTPLGWHVIEERIGGDQPTGRSFVNRKPQKEILKPDQWRNPDSGDYILTRILWLRGLERGLNAGDPSISSHARGIYIHGTNQEYLLGQPASHGCIRLSNRDTLELFDLVEHRHAYCLILAR